MTTLLSTGTRILALGLAAVVSFGILAGVDGLATQEHSASTMAGAGSALRVVIAAPRASRS